MAVEFSAGTVMGMLGIILVGEVWLAHNLVTKDELDRRFTRHKKKHHDK